MTTPRDGRAPDVTPRQPTDTTSGLPPSTQPPAQASQPAPAQPPSALWHSPQPPVFPSVGGEPDSPTRIDHAPAFSRVAESSHEPPPPAALPVETSVPAVPNNENNNGKWRWAAAGLATILLAAVVVGGFLLLGARRPATPSLVAQYAPANPAGYVEVRLDLPGDQRDRIASFMSNFPGFADQASFQQKLDETLSNVLKSSGAPFEWQADVQPWFGGMVGMVLTSEPTSMSDASGVLVFSVKDRTKLDEVIAARGGAGLPSEDYKGAKIYSSAATTSGGTVSFTATEDALIASLAMDDVKAALDAHAGDTQGLADDAFFTAQLAELSADHLGLFYYDYSEVLGDMPVPTGLPGGFGFPSDCMSNVASVSEVTLVGAVRAESDHLSLEVRARAPQVEGFPQFPNRSSDLPQSMPADTVFYLENRAVGQTIKYYVRELLRCLPSDGSFGPNQLEQMLGTAPEDYFDFLEDFAVGVTFREGKFGGGLIATVNDEAVAKVRMERILSVVRLAAGAGQEMTVDEQQHGDATITVINFGDEVVAGTPIPSLSVTVARGRLYIGADDFVTRALDQAAADSLASAPRLTSALNAAGRENAALVYVDVARLRGSMEEMIPADEKQEYETEVKPFVEPITQLVLVGRNEQGIYSSNVFLYVE